MDIIKEFDFRKQIKKKIAAGYLFFGEEDYLKAYAQKILRDIVCTDKTSEEFNDIRMSALDFSAAKLLDDMAPLPLFGERKLIEISGLDFNSMRADELNSLLTALSMLSEFDYNTVLISVTDGGIEEGRLPNRPSSVLTKLGEYLVPVRFEKCTQARLTDWVGKHFEHNGTTASFSVCAKIIEYCGRSMYSLASEIDKVSFYILSHGRSEVTEQDVLNVAVPDNDYDAFAFANALTACDRQRALSVLSLMKQRRIEPIIIMSEVTRVFCDLISVRSLADEGLGARGIGEKLKMHEYRAGLYLSAVSDTSTATLSRVLSLCADADASLKLSPKGYTAIELLICSL